MRSKRILGVVFLATLFLSAISLDAIAPAEEPLVKVVETVRPAVVNIHTERIVQRNIQDPYDLFFGRYYSVRQRVPSLGSGVLIDPSGYIVTCAHVVGRAEDKAKIEITLSDGTALPAEILSTDPDADLALLKISAKAPLPYVSAAAADLSPNLLGETVMALGNPVGYESSVSSGILSAKNRKVHTDEGEAENLLQTNAAINPGNSGGALVDINGKLVGICNAKLAGQAVEGIGFAIPGEKVGPWVEDAIAIAKGKKAAPKPVSLVNVLQERFGVRFQDITPDLAKAFGLPSTDGMLVADVEKGSPADQIGMANGMVLVRIGTVTILDSGSLPRELAKVKAGETVAFSIKIVTQRGSMLIQNIKAVQLQAR